MGGDCNRWWWELTLTTRVEGVWWWRREDCLPIDDDHGDSVELGRILGINQIGIIERDKGV